MEEEIWKNIEGYGGKYQVSNLGRVKSFKRKNNNGRILKPALTGKGYLAVGLCNKTNKSIYVHKLVAIAFLNHTPDNTHKIVVNHKDHNRVNNYLDNLELVSNRYNVTDGYLKKQTTSKYTGVYWNKERKKWKASIWINKRINLGYFKLEIDASNAYQEKLRELIF